MIFILALFHLFHDFVNLKYSKLYIHYFVFIIFIEYYLFSIIMKKMAKLTLNHLPSLAVNGIVKEFV